MSRNLDALVAEHVMGWYWNGEMLGPPKTDKRAIWATEWDENGLPEYLPRYSKDPDAMWEVIEHLSSEHYDFIDLQYDCGSWFCTIKTLRIPPDRDCI